MGDSTLAGSGILVLVEVLLGAFLYESY